ncbi:stage II sporulation protein D [Peribacillus deserti]|uniref:Stage II sporulation protein D n=1 Tax=Peribacillus deserti TaxID=673318 RepID=A0ABS2QD21_9BACI|nr:stage II sporulation protein D [Peribacillus deserti]MBM7690704.1 stage II sporulation protein D [Peribacillus deserti]
MKALKPMIILIIVTAVIILMIPAILVLPFSNESASGKLVEKLETSKKVNSVEKNTGPALEVSVYREAAQSIEDVPLEDYVRGVVAAEMPADFEPEALKAQALTARTYIVKQLITKNVKDAPKGANVTDTESHQVYKNDKELKRIWGSDYSWKIKKIKTAVEETNGQILTYDSNPIEATFFSTSNGYTENSEDYWPNKIPYLKSVESPWDKDSPKFYSQQVMSIDDFQNKLGVQLSSKAAIGTITAKTAGKRVAKVEIGGKELTGKQIREKLNLKSSDFSWIRKGNQVIIYTKGFGHGVGMSQYGANGMAQQGKTYKNIIQHYYKGVQITAAAPYLTKITANK